MTQENPDFRTAVAALVEEEMSGGEHPELETWTAYCRGTLPESERERLQDHLVGCRQCVALLKDLADFERAGGEGTQGVTAFEIALFRRQLTAERTARRQGWRAKIATAAAGLLAVLALGAWSAWSFRGIELAELARPQLNTPIVTFNFSTLRSRLSEPLRLAPGTHFFTLELVLPRAVEPSAYQVVIQDAEEREIWRSEPFTHSLGEDSPTLSLSRRWLPDGALDLVLYGVEPGGARELGSFPLALRER